MDEEKIQLIGVTKDIVEKFLGALEDLGSPADQVKGLRKTLLKEGKNSEKALSNAIFPDE